MLGDARGKLKTYFACEDVGSTLGTDGLQTLRWREMDSNCRFRARLVTVSSLRLRPVRPPQTPATPSRPSLRFIAETDSALEGSGFDL